MVRFPIENTSSILAKKVFIIEGYNDNNDTADPCYLEFDEMNSHLNLPSAFRINTEFNFYFLV